MKLGEHITNNKDKYNKCEICNRVITNTRYKLYTRYYRNKRINTSNNQSIEQDINIDEYYLRQNIIKHLGHANQIKDIDCVRLFYINSQGFGSDTYKTIQLLISKKQ